MPAALINILRPLLMALIQTAAFIGIEKAISLIIDKIQIHFRDQEGLSAEDAQLATENVFVQILIYTGVTFALIKGKVPARIADRMGLNTKGLAARKLSAKGEAKLAGKTIPAKATTKAGAVEADEIAKVVSSTRGLSLSKIKSLLSIITTVVGVPTAVFFAAAQYIDFANWQGPYQKTFQALLSKVGINPDTPLPKASAISDDVWKRIYTVVETLKPSGISMPYTGIDRPYSRQALVDAVNEIATNIIKNGGDATFKNVIGMVLPLLQQPENFAGVDALPNYTAPASSYKAPTTSKATTTPTVKVFTGVVSQGVVGQGLVFQSRPDDLIESIAELREAAANNLAPYLAALPAKVVYEVKVVSSITTANGFKQTGTTQRIQTGTNANGTPKYKTVTNKFATLVLYILTDRGTRTKLTTVVLGPVDSARLTVGQNDLRELETSLPKLVTTSDINEVSNINNTNNTDTTPLQATPDDKLPAEVEDNVDTGYRFYSFTVNGEEYLEILPWGGNIPTGHTMITKKQYLELEAKKIAENTARWEPFFRMNRQQNPNAFTGGISGYILVGGVLMVNPDRYEVTYDTGLGKWSVKDKVFNTSVLYNSQTEANAATGKTTTKVTGVTTLSAYYQALGKSLPSLSERALEYERLGLGQKSYYVGTAEQNTKLLNALLSQ